MAKVKIDYSKFDKAGLKSVVTFLKGEGHKVSDIEANNTQKREAGYPIKAAKLTFEDGQVLELKVKAEGSLYQAKLNNKLLAIKKYHEPDTFMKEVADYITQNAPSFAKNRERAAVRKARVALPSLKGGSSSFQEQIDAKSAALAQLQADNEEAGRRLTDLQSEASTKDATLTELNGQIRSEQQRGEELQNQIDALKAA